MKKEFLLLSLLLASCSSIKKDYVITSISYSPTPKWVKKEYQKPDKNYKYFVSKADARDAFLQDVQLHRDLIEKAFDKYGKAFCIMAKANEDRVEERILIHDLSKINDEIESAGNLAYYYQYPMKNQMLPPSTKRCQIRWLCGIFLML